MVIPFYEKKIVKKSFILGYYISKISKLFDTMLFYHKPSDPIVVQVGVWSIQVFGQVEVVWEYFELVGQLKAK